MPYAVSVRVVSAAIAILPFAAAVLTGGRGRVGYDPLDTDRPSAPGMPGDGGGSDGSGSGDGTVSAGDATQGQGDSSAGAPDAPADVTDASSGLSPDAADSGADAGADADAAPLPPCNPQVVPVVTGATNASRPSLVASAVGYGIAWMDDRNGNTQIYFARLDAAGTKIGSDVRISSGAGPAAGAKLVWNGSEYAVVWLDSRGGSPQVYFARIDAAGAKIGADLAVTTSLGNAGGVGLAWSGSEYGVAFQDTALQFARVSSTGALTSGPSTVMSNAVIWVGDSIEWTGASWGIGWVATGSMLSLTRLDATGALVGSTLGIGTSMGDNVVLVWNGSGYGLVWVNVNTMSFLRIDATGTALGAPVTLPGVTPRVPRLVWSGAGYGIVWGDVRGAAGEADFISLDATGTALAGYQRLSDMAALSGGPSVAWSGALYAGAWEDQRAGNYDVYFRLVCP